MSPPHVCEVFQRCAALGRAAFIPFLMAGDPDPGSSRALIGAAAESGADLVEIGIPYSDPLADGATIQAASQRARAAGTTFERALAIARECTRRHPATGFIGFTYYNPVFVRGIEKTAADFAAAGLTGIVVPDLPVGEASTLCAAFARRSLSVTFLVAPTTPLARAADIAQRCTGFVYVVSRLGTTGVSALDETALIQRIAALRGVTAKPLAVGFGVASAADAALVARSADGVVVGSALIDRTLRTESPEAAEREVRASCEAFARACSRAATRSFPALQASGRKS
ncbi:MAG: tryptophan synthase subunit alpha [Candidatus Eremiobacteraeota bacterium]|nr:tryptophan synthase subunit alpha [Candidatus Eremiobacteraeota bacterium]